MKLPPFRIERFFDRYEFAVPHLLCASDCEPLTLVELLALADDETRALWEGLSLSYTEAAGSPLLRQAIAALYSGLAAEDIFVLAPEEGIFVAMNVLLSPGDQVVATYPGYQSLYELARAIGCTVRFWQPREGAIWHFDLDDLAPLLTPQTRLLVVNFPHNPTGALPTPEEWTRIQVLAAERGVRIFSDEIYRFLEHDGGPSLNPACSESASSVCLGGLSKAFGLPGLRLGWLATRDGELLRACSAFKDYTTICPPAPSQALALMALRAKDALLARCQGILAANLPVLARFFDAHAEQFAWARPRGGSVGLARLRHGDITEYAAALVRRAGVLLLPGEAMDFPGPHFRLGYGRRNLPQAVAAWEQSLHP